MCFPCVFFKLHKWSGGSRGQRQFYEQCCKWEQLAARHKTFRNEHTELVKKKKKDERGSWWEPIMSAKETHTAEPQRHLGFVNCVFWGVSHFHSVCPIPYSVHIDYLFLQHVKHYSCVLYIACSIDEERQTLLMPRPEIPGKDTGTLFFNHQSLTHLVQWEVKGWGGVPEYANFLQSSYEQRGSTRRKHWFWAVGSKLYHKVQTV